MRDNHEHVKMYQQGQRLLLAPIVFLLCFAGPTIVAKAGLNPGDIVVIDRSAGTDGKGELFRVNPASGNREIISDFGDAIQGPTANNPGRVAIESTGEILVIDHDVDADTGLAGGKGALYRVNPSTGLRTVLSDFSDTDQGPLGINPFGVAVESTGQILVSDQDGGNGECHALFRIDPSSGMREILANLGSSSENQCDDNASYVTLENTGQILMLFTVGVLDNGLILRIDPVTGDPTLVHDFGSAIVGPTGNDPQGITVEDDGNILASARENNFANEVIFRINSDTNERTILSNFGDVTQGVVNGIGWSGLALESNGNIILAAHSSLNEAGARGKVYRVSPTTGNRFLLSDFNNAGQGPIGKSPVGVAVVPPDTDGDGQFDSFDNCPDDANPGQEDADQDGLGDVCDNCAEVSNDDQADTDSDGVGNACDNCIDDSNTDQADADEDGIGDVCDPDDDNDGVADVQDLCQNSLLGLTVVIDGCDSGAENDVDLDGCSISDQILACSIGARNHGAFLRCVSRLSNSLKKTGVITGTEKTAITSCSGMAGLP